MNFAVKTSLGILLIIVLINADIDQSNVKFKKQCQVRKREKVDLFVLIVM